MKLGDVVTLKSGGPPLTIEGLRPAQDGAPDGQVECVYFGGENYQELRRVVLAVTSVKPAEG